MERSPRQPHPSSAGLRRVPSPARPARFHAQPPHAGTWPSPVGRSSLVVGRWSQSSVSRRLSCEPVVERRTLDGDRIFTIDRFLSDGECKAFIAQSETAGYDEASITTSAGAVVDKEVRDNARLIVDDPELAGRLCDRARASLPATTEACRLTGLNERFRFYRYDPGQKFRLH